MQPLPYDLISSSPESGGERTVEIVLKRNGTPFFFQLQGRQLSKQLLNDVFVFFSFKTAGAVNENSAGLQ